MADKLYAADRHRQRNRRVGAVILGALGLGVAGAVGYYLYKWIAVRAVTPASQSPAWNACEDASRGSTTPRFNCGDSATYSGQAVTVTNRTWTSEGWLYGIEGSGVSLNAISEGDLA